MRELSKTKVSEKNYFKNLIEGKSYKRLKTYYAYDRIENNYIYDTEMENDYVSPKISGINAHCPIKNRCT